MRKIMDNKSIQKVIGKKGYALIVSFFISITFLVLTIFQRWNGGLQNIWIVLSLFFLVLSFILLRFVYLDIKKIFTDLHQKSKEKPPKVEIVENSKDDFLQKYQGLDYAIDNAALFASVAHDGTVHHISKKFSNLLGLHKQDMGKPLEELLSFDEGEQQSIRELLKGKRSSMWQGEVQVTTKLDKKLWLEMSIVPMEKAKEGDDVLILCTDITARIISQNEIDLLNEQRFLEEVNLQKSQASQIVEAQEEERKRIAKDIHDGIGQMLTALKFNIESIKAENIDATSKKVKTLKEFLGMLIKEVRTVTFNLTPPELSDYGVASALGKLAIKLSNFTGKNIYFDNKTNFEGRFDSLTETNLYRVVQEAVNNALKYADSNYILISVSHSNEKLSIVIDDDGLGFEVDKLLDKSKESGMGLFFMKERISYINGRLFISSVKEKGTRITINLDLKK